VVGCRGNWKEINNRTFRDATDILGVILDVARTLYEFSEALSESQNLRVNYHIFASLPELGIGVPPLPA